MDDTPLDVAHAAMQAAPEDDAARLRFYERIATAELYLLLTEEPEGEKISPRLFEADGATFVLVFDREERLGAFAQSTAPFAALPGRTLVGMIAAQGLGLGLNLDVAPSSFLMGAEAVDWLAATLDAAPAEAEARPQEFHPPRGLPEALLTALDARLGLAAGLARKAYLAGVIYDDGARGHLLGLTGTVPGAEPTLARAVNEALVFSGIDAGALDVAFLKDSDPTTAQLARVGLRFDLPESPAAPEHTPKAPGSDPDRPPKLR